MKHIVIFCLGNNQQKVSPDQIKMFEKQLKDVKKGKKDAIVVDFPVTTQTQLILDDNEIDEFYNSENQNNLYNFEEEEDDDDEDNLEDDDLN